MSFAKLLYLGNIICRERRHNLLTHKLHIVSQQDCSAENHRFIWGHSGDARESDILTEDMTFQSWSQDRVQIYTPEGPRGEAALFRRQTTVDPYNLHTVTWFHPVDEVIVCNDVDRTWQLSSRGFLWHLLNGQRLVVLIAAQPKLCLQRIVFFILHMQNFMILNILNTKSVVNKVWLLGFFPSRTFSWINIHISVTGMLQDQQKRMI